jgi:hypothetical protein
MDLLSELHNILYPVSCILYPVSCIQRPFFNFVDDII